MLQDNISINKQVARTREWILGALIKLMENQPYEKISILNITEKAGVARQSFYRNYESKEDILIKFIDSIFTEFITEAKQIRKDESLNVVYTVLFQVLLRHKYELQIIEAASLDYLLYNSFWSYNQFFIQYLFMDTNKTNQDFDEYFIKYQFGGIIAITLEWLQNGMRQDPRELGIIIDKITQPFRSQESYLPVMLNKIK